VIAAAGSTARARDILAANGAASFRGAIAARLVDLPQPPRRPPAEPISVHALRDGNRAVRLGPAFGHSHASALGQLARAAAASGAAGFRTAPPHVLMIVGLPPHGAARLADMAQRLGFVVQASDRRRRVFSW